jgi:cytochrome P450
MGWDWSVGFRQADETHQTIRKMLRTGIGPQRVGSHDPLIERTAVKWLLTIQDLKGDPVKEISQYVEIRNKSTYSDLKMS